LLTHWALIEADLHERYGVDVETDVLRERSSRWLVTRIAGLLTVESRLRTALYPPEPTKGTPRGPQRR
jgi:hypothetical protein